jgi:hypothetical protein
MLRRAVFNNGPLFFVKAKPEERVLLIGRAKGIEVI